jgi:hypothetical protein
MAVTSAADIVRLALKDAGVLGVGQTASAEDTNDVFDTMNLMLAQWSIKRWLVFHLLDMSVVSTGAISYTVGPGGDINTGSSQRPDRLEDGCFYRQLITASSPNQIDYPLSLLESREDYSRIGLKQLSTIPQYIFYDPAMPLGVIYPWPIPSAVKYEIHIAIKDQLQQFANLADTINLPNQYKAALRYNLGATIRPLYQMPPDPTLTALALTSLNIIKNSNAAIPRLRIPIQLGRGALYNIFSDRIY